MVINPVLELVFNGSNAFEVVSECLFGPTQHVIDTYIYIYKFFFFGCFFSSSGFEKTHCLDIYF